MTALLAGLFLAVIAFLILWRVGRLPARALGLACAGLMLGYAGFLVKAVDQPGAPVATSVAEADPGVAAHVSGDETQWLAKGQELLTAGQARSAAATLLAATAVYPRSAALWATLGGALIVQADGLVTPAAKLALARGRRLDPSLPQPLYFEGLGFAQQGQYKEARARWLQALALTPADAPFRAQLVDSLKQLDATDQPRP